jgi:4-amino-4-deoxy-L-arabinose transferase-like glycosyltransferase
MKKLILFIFFFFFFAFIFFSFKTMKNTSFHDFDEANRAEAVKNMKEYRFFLAPLTGSPFLRNEKLAIKVKDNPNLSLFIHLERPPLFFWLTAISTSLFDDSELAYRMPSFLFGLAIILITFFLHPLSALTILLSTDLWLSSQNALMDTMLTFFLFIAFLLFLKSLRSKNKLLYFLTGLFWGLSFLAKGQPAVIFVFPLVFSLFVKKINLKNFFLIFVGCFVVIFPWIFLVIYNFGFDNFVFGFLGFASKRTFSFDPSQKAPIFWYLRWWFESFRVGSILFFILLINDFLTKKFDFKKLLILSYFIPSFLLFSLAKNKVWWYVLPLIPVSALYIHYSISHLLKTEKNKLLNLSIIVFFSSLPILFNLSNKLALICQLLMIIFSVLILRIKIKKKVFFIYPLVIFFSLLFFTFRFPKINPNIPEAKKVGEYYQKLPQPKCLFVKNIPYEAILFYTNAKEINYLGERPLFKNCQNYLITSDTNSKYQKIFQHKRLILYKL